MDKYNEIYGVDISKDVFDVQNSKGDYFQLTNDEKGFKNFVKRLSKESLIVMEATGYYHYRLAQYLYEQGYSVSVGCIQGSNATNVAFFSESKLQILVQNPLFL